MVGMSLLRELNSSIGALEALEVLIEGILRPLYLFVLALAAVLVEIVKFIQVTGEVWVIGWS